MARKKGGKVRVKVVASVSAAGKVIVFDTAGKLKKNLATGKLKNGKVTIALPRLKKGKHNLTVTYTGSATVMTATSGKKSFRVT